MHLKQASLLSKEWGAPHPADKNSAVVKLNKNNGPRYVLVVSWQKQNTKSNKGYFAISSKAQT